MAEYVNVAGVALAVSARDAVLKLRPRAYVKRSQMRIEHDEPMAICWLVRDAKTQGDCLLDPRLGSGATEEAAWRSALSALLMEADDA